MKKINIEKLIIPVSVLALSFLIWLIYIKQGTQYSPTSTWIFALPAVNASLNFLSASFMVLGLVAIKNGKRLTHQRWMTSAFVASSLFLVGYILYHFFHGETKFIAQGPIRYIYFFILISHIVLSAVALPMILRTFYLGWSQKWERHKKLARWTFPIWFYVSVTGVIIFFFLKFLNK